MADAECSPALRDRALLEEARTCLAETAGRGSTFEEREAALVWLQEAARDERNRLAARRKIAVSPRKPHEKLPDARNGTDRTADGAVTRSTTETEKGTPALCTVGPC